jgi:hypothetical protein
VTLLVVPLVPEAYRKAWKWPMPLPETPVAWAVALLHVGLATLVWGFAYTAYQKEFGDMIAAMVADPSGSGEVGPFMLYGIFGFFAFPLTWKGFLAWTYLLDSVARFVALAVHGGFHASLFVALPLWLFERITGIRATLQMNRTYGGAEEPDRLFESEGGLVIRCTRPHPEWHRLVAFHYRGRLFRLQADGEVREGERRAFEYRFAPWPEHDIARRIILLAPETGEEAPSGCTPGESTQPGGPGPGEPCG